MLVNFIFSVLVAGLSAATAIAALALFIGVFAADLAR